MFKEVTPDEADPLSLAGLLWFCFSHTPACEWLYHPWTPDPYWMPARCQERFGDYKFWILLEE